MALKCYATSSYCYDIEATVATVSPCGCYNIYDAAFSLSEGKTDTAILSPISSINTEGAQIYLNFVTLSSTDTETGFETNMKPKGSVKTKGKMKTLDVF